MKAPSHYPRLSALLLLLALSLSLCACGARDTAPPQEAAPDLSRYLVSVEDEPETVDFQRTTIHYTIAQNVFDRLVEMESAPDGTAQVLPALAESWSLSDDRLSYSFRLREGVRFSNGEALTASDVLYTFTRLLTHPESRNRDIAAGIRGAGALLRGETRELEGFRILNDREFTITLSEPYEGFLACLSMPGASILDAETTEQAGDRFGLEAAWTVGTGSFILESWEPGWGMILRANTDCWQGAPRCEGLILRFYEDPEEIRLCFDKGELDLLDLDEVGKRAEFYLHGDVYPDRLYTVNRIGINYIALNEAVPPLDDVRVRRALQLALNRELLLDVAYSGLGEVENGIMPQGLYGHNEALEALPYDPEAARALLAEAGCPEGFSLTVSASGSSTTQEIALLRAAADMWAEIGVDVRIEALEYEQFLRRRSAGELACYTASWTADFNDPDNFFSTFFGSEENTRFRSLCYPREEIMARVRAARGIAEPEARIAEYRALERIIVHEDAAWIPLFSRQRCYVRSERLSGICSSWNGSVKNMYRSMSVTAEDPAP